MSEQWRTDEAKASAGGRMLTFAAWSVLVLGLWLWGRELTVAPPRTPGRPAGR